MMVELWTRKREMGDEYESDMEDTSGYEKSGVWLAWLGLEEAWVGLEDLVSMLLPAESVLVPAVLGMVNWLAHEILSSRLASGLSNSLSNQAFLPRWSACKKFHHLFEVHEASCSKVQNLSWPIFICEGSVYLMRPAVKHRYEDTGECTKESTKVSTNPSTNTVKWENDIYMLMSNSHLHMGSSRWPNSTL